MKNVKKVLALMLSVSMMLCIVSVCASAIDTTTASYKVTYKDADNNVISSAKAGEQVNVFVGIKTDGYSPNFSFQAFYDVNLTQVAADGSARLTKSNATVAQDRFASDAELEVSDELIDYELGLPAGGSGVVLDWGAGAINNALHNKNMYPSTWTDEQKAQYKGFKSGYKTTMSASVMTVNTENQFVDYVKISFTANVDVALDENTFIFDKDASYINIYPEDECLSTAQTLGPVKVSGNSLIVEYEGGITPPSTSTVKVNNLSTQIQWADKETGRVNLGFRGQIAEGYDATTDWNGKTSPTGGKELATLKEVGFYIGNGKYQSETIYDFTNGTYFYRVIVGAQYTDTTTLSARAYVVIGGQEYKADSTITTSAKAEYTRATALENGMEAK